jgi:sugar (pentulose or hexulose) kinase
MSVSPDSDLSVPSDGVVVIGVDIGTTSTKSVAYDGRGRPGASSSVGYPLDEPAAGYAEQDPQQILDAVITRSQPSAHTSQRAASQPQTAISSSECGLTMCSQSRRRWKRMEINLFCRP